jgi:hypothetical protein
MDATDIGSGAHVPDIGCGAGHSTAMIDDAGASPFCLSAPGVLEAGLRPLESK